MTTTSKIAPYVQKPNRINNITHAIVLLKMKQKKNEKYATKYIPSTKVLYKESSDKFDYSEVIQGFLEHKLVDKHKKSIERVLKDSDKFVAEKLTARKEEVEMDSINVIMKANTEERLFQTPSPVTFGDEFMHDMFVYVNQNMEPQQFLARAYEKFVMRFMKQNGGPESKNALELVRDFVRLKYSKNEFNMAVFEDRYLFAELYCLLRLGRIEDAKELLSQFSHFFNGIHSNFGDNFTNYLDHSKFDMVVCTMAEDKFKMYLCSLTRKNVISDGVVVSTVEDYLYTLLQCNRKLESDDFENKKIQLLVNLFNKDTKAAAKILLKSDFELVAKFHILHQLCLADSVYGHAEESTSMLSLRSYSSKTESSKQTRVFMNFFFAVTQKMSKMENKLNLMDLIQNNEEYVKLIPEYLIKYELYDLIRNPCLSSSIFSRTVEHLKATNSRKLLEFASLLDISTSQHIVEDVLEQAILTDEKLEIDLNKIDSTSTILAALIPFYEFNFNPNPVNLNNLVLFTTDDNLIRFKFIIEHIFNKAVAQIRESQDKIKAKRLFKLCGQLELSNECSETVTRELVELI
ncbi:hypothetical protein ECANGB1_302 [Enterospora canceri]|uniref:Nuclear pore protein n=1 Tax=Enterospora canceri TaxID=1081671 RepID=A0A1Y1S9A0_9MICR|nr:hypothetical protein ECANGB1_302 [Enterospora canceri]